MIIVIADDFSGAAEIAGVGLRYGLKSVIQTEANFNVDSDILILDSNTRSATEAKAGLQIKQITEQLKKNRWEWIYKKTDSVLRGHILKELTCLVRYLEKHNVLFIPQNPGTGKVISGGRYLVNGTPLHLTEFSKDPVFPRKTSDVLRLLGTSDEYQTQILTPGSQIREKSVAIGTAHTDKDLDSWAEQLQPETIASGGSEFFAAILRSKGSKSRVKPTMPFNWKDKKVLIVSGSISASYKQLIGQKNMDAFIDCHMPCTVRDLNTDFIQKWQDNIIDAFRKSSKVILSINQEVEQVPEKLGRLTDILAIITSRVLKSVPVNELFIEGGDTASGILRKLGWKKFVPIEEWGTGVIRMDVPGEPTIKLTTKPGNYPWPDL